MAKKEVLANFIPISRRLFEHRLWCEEREYSRFEAWLYLIKEARFEDTKLYDGNKVIEVKRGQVYASIRFFAKAWKWSPKKVLGYFDLLINDKMIVKETVKETGQSVITICKYEEYNSISENRKQQRKQQGNSTETKSNKVNTDNNVIPPISPKGIVESEPKKTWRDSFEVYKEDLREAYQKLIYDKEWIDQQERYHPNLDIGLSLEKACVQFWALEAGWIHKKKSKTVNIDWKSTLASAIERNKVYKQKQ